MQKGALMNEATTDYSEVSSAVQKIIRQYLNNVDAASRRAILAKLRHSIGKPLSQSVDIWPLILTNVPDDFLSEYEGKNLKMQAVIYTLQIYALYEQGNLTAEDISSDNTDTNENALAQSSSYNMGSCLRILRLDEKQRNAMDRRFSNLITSDNIEHFYYNLRQLTGILKSKTKDSHQHINYPRLAHDLYWFNFIPEKIRLSWAQEYYRFN